MLIKKSEITQLSNNVRQAIDGQPTDFRSNQEGVLSILKNDIHTLITIRNEQMSAIQVEHDLLAEYLADISHQLKTPITSMRIMADLLENATPDKQQEFIANIKISLNRMEWLVASLLKMARIDSGTVEFFLTTTLASKLVTAATEPLEILLDVKNQKMELLNDIELLCDSRWTTEALTNLIKNASDYSPMNSKISVNCGVTPIYSWIAITDGGDGIPKEEISSLFKRFKGSRSQSGYGIGLPLALSIMRGQNGDIDVDGGEKGAGATFTVKFYR